MLKGEFVRELANGLARTGWPIKHMNRIARETSDLATVEIPGRERLPQLGVLGLGDLLSIHDPFPASQLRVQAPMQEHAVAQTLEPPNAGLGHGNRLLFFRGIRCPRGAKSR